MEPINTNNDTVHVTLGVNNIFSSGYIHKNSYDTLVHSESVNIKSELNVGSEIEDLNIKTNAFNLDAGQSDYIIKSEQTDDMEQVKRMNFFNTTSSSYQSNNLNIINNESSSTNDMETINTDRKHDRDITATNTNLEYCKIENSGLNCEHSIMDSVKTEDDGLQEYVTVVDINKILTGMSELFF